MATPLSFKINEYNCLLLLDIRLTARIDLTCNALFSFFNFSIKSFVTSYHDSPRGYYINSLLVTHNHSFIRRIMCVRLYLRFNFNLFFFFYIYKLKFFVILRSTYNTYMISLYM